MKEYTGDRIRNVAIVGHGGAGTTSVTEALLYRSGAISRMCKVEDGATTTDYEPEEIKRGVSVNATLAPVEWRDTKINFIDTPGFADFVAEVKGAFRAVDSALIVVCATSGVQVGTEQCWKLAEEAHLPRIIFVNKMDRENADFDSILDNLRAKIGKRVLPLQLPLGKEADFFICTSTKDRENNRLTNAFDQAIHNFLIADSFAFQITHHAVIISLNSSFDHFFMRFFGILQHIKILAWDAL